MDFYQKIAIFVILFSILFFWIHASGFYGSSVIVSDLGGLPWLYSSLMTLFAILAGFTIQKQWENWDSLIDSVKSEVDSLRELFFWSKYLPEEYKDRFSRSIIYYLKEMIGGGLTKSEDEKSKKIDQAFSSLRTVIFEMSQKDQQFTATTFAFLTKIMESRTKRLLYGFHHIPLSLKSTLFFCTFLVIVLCLFIAIQNVWLDYSFTISLSLMTYMVCIIINDLDNPLIPGNWHLTTRDYESLLKQIEGNQEA